MESQQDEGKEKANGKGEAEKSSLGRRLDRPDRLDVSEEDGVQAGAVHSRKARRVTAVRERELRSDKNAVHILITTL